MPDPTPARRALARYFTVAAALFATLWVFYVGEVFAQLYGPVKEGGNVIGWINVTYYGNTPGGVKINVVFTSNNGNVPANYRWVQIITNETTGVPWRNGRVPKPPYIDPPNGGYPYQPGGDDNQPFYWNNGEENAAHNGKNYNFGDKPGRPKKPCERWSAELWLTHADGMNMQVLQCIEYGWHYENNGTINKIPPNFVNIRPNIANILNDGGFPGWNVTSAAVVTPPVKPVDTDKDGVPDYLDNCPNETLGPLDVDGNGCGDGGAFYRTAAHLVQTGEPVAIELHSNYDGYAPEFKILAGPAGATIDASGAVPVLRAAVEDSEPGDGGLPAYLEWTIQMMVPTRVAQAMPAPVPGDGSRVSVVGRAVGAPAPQPEPAPEPVPTTQIVLEPGPTQVVRVQPFGVVRTVGPDDGACLDDVIAELLAAPSAGGGRVLQLECGLYHPKACNPKGLVLPGGSSSSDPLYLIGGPCGGFNKLGQGQVAYRTAAIDGDVLVTGSHVKISNLTVLGSVAIDSGGTTVPIDVRLGESYVVPAKLATGVSVKGASAVQVASNIVEGGAVAVRVSGSTDVRIINNTLVDQMMSIQVTSDVPTAGVTSLNNILSPVDGPMSAAYCLDGGSSKVLANSDHNFFLAAGRSPFTFANLGGSRLTSLLVWQQVSGLDRSSLFGSDRGAVLQPVKVGEDFNPWAPVAPPNLAIDAGVFRSEAALDIELQPRSNPPDIGADEFQ